MLTKHPDTQAIWAFNDPSALGAGATVRARGGKVWSGRQKGVIVIGSIGSKEAADAIKAGGMTVTYDQNGPLIGAKAVEALAVALKCKRLAAMPKRIIVPAIRYDLSNISKWRPPLSRKVTIKTAC